MYAHYLYSLFEELNKYYIGETSDLEQRLIQHNTSFFKNSYSSAANDWVIALKIECENIAHARRVEGKIKSMKSKTYINNLIKYRDLVEKIVSENQ